ncbi:MAG: DUF3990 domain-containing protein [Lachnospiraceae bacterium]|nr:DUF3990 domain-containing protein [Lachnospiraceae bacterium]
MIIYHGSNKTVENPLYGYGKATNDYGQGFYCTEDVELAKEWACADEKGGFVNTYRLNVDGLRVLKLNEANVIEWLAILLKHRLVRYSSPMEKRTADYIISNFYTDISDYDVIMGYRADDSYFSYVRSFLSNTISLQQLAGAMKYGNLGIQVFIQSEKAFERLNFIESNFVYGTEYYSKRIERDFKARESYYKMLEEDAINGIYARDIIGKEMKLDELCL